MSRRFVSVSFDSTPYKNYHFLTDIDDLKKGDFVVVDTKLGYNIAKVNEFISKPFTEAVINKWVVQKVDLATHKKRLVKEEKLNKVKEQMEARKTELQDIELFTLLAQKDDAMKDLLQTYLELLQ